MRATDRQLREVERAMLAGDPEARVRWWAMAHSTTPPRVTAEMMEARALTGDIRLPYIVVRDGQIVTCCDRRIIQARWSVVGLQVFDAVRKLRKMRGLRTAANDGVWTITDITEGTTISIGLPAGLHTAVTRTSNFDQYRGASKGERKRKGAQRRKSRQRKRWQR